jgi:hypothetical protein
MGEKKTINILLVEDDEVDVENVRRAFKKNQIDNPLYLASNGLEALDILRSKNNPPVVPTRRLLILLDLNMPKMGGIEFLKVLRADSQLKKIPVVVLTTSNEEQDQIAAYELNVAGYLLKPINFRGFVETIETFHKYWTSCEII